MKKLKLFFACLLMAVLSIGQVWGADPAPVGTTLFSEDFSGYAKDAVPSGEVTTATGRVVYGGANVTYSVTNGGGTTKIYTENSAGGTSPEILVGKSNGTLTIAGIPSGGAKAITVSYKQNKQKLKVESTTTGYSGSKDEKPSSVGANSVDITIADGSAETFTLVFTCTGSSNVRVDDILVTVKTAGEGGGSTPTVATPTFSLAAGTYAGTQSVTLACETEGSTIYYTTDGTAPTNESTEYTAAISVSESQTIKAIAYVGSDASSVASAAYTVLTPLTTMDQIFAAAGTAGTTPTQVAITFNNWVVTGVKSSNAYVTDGTKGFIIYTSSHGFQVGDILSGTAVCKVQLYNGSAELTELTASKVTVNTGGSVSPVVLDAEGIAALTGANTGSVIKISGACTYESSKYYIAGVQLYNQLYSFSVSAGTNYECTGVYVLNTTYGNEILPRSAADIVAQTSVANPTFSPAAGEYTEVQNVTLSCATDGATVYYTTDGTNPTNESTVYSSAIEVGASMTIKAIAYKGEDHSEVVSAAYTINIPLPSHDFQVTHHFSTGEGFEFPTGWGGSYAEHEIAYTDDKVHFVSASHQSGTITDRPVTKNQAISLILTNSHKLISAVRFDYAQWGTKAQTLMMKYSTDGGENYSDFDPVVSSTDFALQVLTMPAGVNAIQVTGANSSNQVGLTSIAFDLEDKVVETKTVTITTPSNGTLVVKNAGVAISSGDPIEVGTTLTIEATPASGYLLSAVSVVDEDEDPVSISEGAFVVPSKNVTVSATFIENVKPDATLTLSEIGVTHDITGNKQDDVINLPLTATSCSKTFVGWDPASDCDHAPTYAPGASYTLANTTQTLYAVYADAAAGSSWDVATSVTAGDVVVISTNTGYTANPMKTAGAISSSIFGATASTYGSENAQITELADGTMEFTIGGNATDGWTLMNGTKYLKVTATKKVNLVDDEETWTINFSGNNATLAPKTGDYTGYSIQYNYNTGNDRFTAYNTTQVAISLYKQVASYSNYSTDCQAAVATPTFSPAAGTYTEAQTVTISCATEEATIYYTTDGSTPTNESTEYTAAISVDENMTIKAIAVKAGMANSAVASATYTINLPLSTMNQIFAAATAAGSTATDVNITFGNWVVSGVSTNAKNVFVTDGTKGLIIFDSGASMGFAVGDVLSGTVACKVQLYKGAAELTTLSSSTEGLNVATGGVITPAAKAISELGGINTGAPVIINSVQFDGTNLSDGANEIKPYNTLFAYEALENGKYYNVTGIYQQFDATKEILPRSTVDIVEVDLADPEISYSPAEETIEVGDIASWSAPTFNNDNNVEIESYATSNSAVATVTDGGVIALAGGIGTAVITAHFAGNAIYAAANATYTITVNPASVSENVVILAVYDTKYYAMSTTNASSAFTAIAVEYDGEKVTVNSADDKAAIQWTKKTSGDNTTFQDADSKYMKSADGTSMSLQDAVCNWIWDEGGFYKISGTSRTFFYQNGTGFKNFATSNFNKSGYSDKAQVIAIAPENIVITSKVSAELSYDPASDVITQGGAWSAPTLVNPYSVTITSYASDNESVATVEGGVIALAGGIGTAHITAHFDGDASYLEGDAVYTITVNEAGDDLSGTWTLASSVAAGDRIIIASIADASDVVTMSAQTSNNRSGVASTVSGTVLNPAAATKSVTLVDAGNGKFALQLSNGNYLYASSNSSNQLKETDVYEENGNAQWVIAFDEGVATITAQGSNSRNVMRYNPNNGSPLFACYASSSTIGTLVTIYKHGAAPEPVLDWTEVRDELEVNRFYTVCLPKAITHIKGATFWTLANRNAAGTLAYLTEKVASELEPLPAGKPFIIRATAAKLEVVYDGDAVEYPIANGALRGLLNSTMNQAAIDEAATTEGSDIYMLKNNELRKANDQTGNSMVEYRAYVVYKDLNVVDADPVPAPGRRVLKMPMHTDAAQGFESVEASEKPMKLMIDGQMYILRGEKMYDATGRLVK